MRELAARSVRSCGEACGSLLRALSCGIHFHSLDAVLVAIVWQSVFRIAFYGTASQPAQVISLGLIVWLGGEVGDSESFIEVSLKGGTGMQTIIIS